MWMTIMHKTEQPVLMRGRGTITRSADCVISFVSFLGGVPFNVLYTLRFVMFFKFINKSLCYIWTGYKKLRKPRLMLLKTELTTRKIFLTFQV